MDHRAASKKLFHAVVMIGLAAGYEVACSDDPSPTPTADGGTQGGGDAATAPTDGGTGGGQDAFSGWAPCQ